MNYKHMLNKNHKTGRFALICAAVLLTGNLLFSQSVDTTAAVAKPVKDNKPVKDPFSSGYILNNQTTLVPDANTLEFVIQHRFGLLDVPGFSLLGLYAPSNIRIGMSYCISDHIELGIGTTKNDELQDFNWKWAILKQTRSGSIPVSITYFGNVTADARPDIFPEFSNRLSYYHEIIISRKFSNAFSLEFAPSYSHFNMMDSLLKWDNFALSMSGRLKVRKALGVIFEYNYLFTKQPEAVTDVKPGLTLGIEAATSGHIFQIFIGSMNNLSEQYDVLNTNDFFKKDILIGFNITRLWNL
jgi:hypothetical protein